MLIPQLSSAKACITIISGQAIKLTPPANKINLWIDNHILHQGLGFFSIFYRKFYSVSRSSGIFVFNRISCCWSPVAKVPRVGWRVWRTRAVKLNFFINFSDITLVDRKARRGCLCATRNNKHSDWEYSDHNCQCFLFHGRNF